MLAEPLTEQVFGRLLSDMPTLLREGEKELLITCEGNEKAKILMNLLTLGILFTDFKVEEPGLEAIYRLV